jgi:hypothetical protein
MKLQCRVHVMDPVVRSRLLDLLGSALPLDVVSGGRSEDLLQDLRNLTDVLQGLADAASASPSSPYVTPLVVATAVQHDPFYQRDDKFSFSQGDEFLRSWTTLKQSKEPLAAAKLDALFRAWVPSEGLRPSRGLQSDGQEANLRYAHRGYFPRDVEALMAFTHDDRVLYRRRQHAGEPYAAIGCVTEPDPTKPPRVRNDDCVSFDMDAYMEAVRGIRQGDIILRVGDDGRAEEDRAEVEADEGVVRCKSHPERAFDIERPWNSTAFLYPSSWPRDNLYDRSRAATSRYALTWRRPPVDGRRALKALMDTVTPTATDRLRSSPRSARTFLSTADLEGWARREHGVALGSVPWQQAVALVSANVAAYLKRADPPRSPSHEKKPAAAAAPREPRRIDASALAELGVEPAAADVLDVGSLSKTPEHGIAYLLLNLKKKSKKEQVTKKRPRAAAAQGGGRAGAVADTAHRQLLVAAMAKEDDSALMELEQAARAADGSDVVAEVERELARCLSRAAAAPRLLAAAPPTPASSGVVVVREHERTMDGVDDPTAYRPWLGGSRALDWIGALAATATAGGATDAGASRSVDALVDDVLRTPLDAGQRAALASTLELYNSEAVMRADLQKELGKIARAQYTVEKDASWQKLSAEQRRGIEEKVKRRASDKEREIVADHRTKSMLLGAAYVAVLAAPTTAGGLEGALNDVSQRLVAASMAPATARASVAEYADLLLRENETLRLRLRATKQELAGDPAARPDVVRSVPQQVSRAATVVMRLPASRELDVAAAPIEHPAVPTASSSSPGPAPSATPVIVDCLLKAGGGTLSVCDRRLTDYLRLSPDVPRALVAALGDDRFAPCAHAFMTSDLAAALSRAARDASNPLAPALRPVLEACMSREVRDYLDRASASAPWTAAWAKVLLLAVSTPVAATPAALCDLLRKGPPSLVSLTEAAVGRARRRLLSEVHDLLVARFAAATVDVAALQDAKRRARKTRDAAVMQQLGAIDDAMRSDILRFKQMEYADWRDMVEVAYASTVRTMA